MSSTRSAKDEKYLTNFTFSFILTPLRLILSTTIRLRNSSYHLIILKEISGYRCKGFPIESIGMEVVDLTGYTYNPRSKKCSSYRYRGTGVTKNSYQSKKECEAQCGKLFLHVIVDRNIA